MTSGIPYSSQSPDIGQSSDGGVSDFRISGQSLTKENCHNSGTSGDNEMKLGPETKLDDDVISRNCEVIAVFPIYGRFGAIWNPDSGCIVCKIFVFIKSNLLSSKNRTKKF